MKSLSRLAVLCCAAALWSCSALADAGAGYKLVVLGDLHFDGAAYHQTIPTKGYRLRERERNLGMWKGPSQELLKDAAKHLDTDVPFVIQVGDITQGDCETVALHEQMFRDAYSSVKGLMKGYRFLGVKGNHDVRLLKGDNSEAATNAYLPILAKEAGLPELKTGNYAVMQGPDLYLFVDSHGTPKGSVSGFVEKKLAAHPDTRYVFFVTHLPIIPLTVSRPGWLCTDYAKVRDLLMTRKAVILAGHTHIFSYAVYRDKEGRTLPQLVITSVGNLWAPEKKLEKTLSGFDLLCEQTAKKYRDKKHHLKCMADYPVSSVPEFTVFSAVSGHAVLDVNDDGVTARIYTGKPDPAIVIPMLRK